MLPCLILAMTAAPAQDQVAGNLLQLVENGGWCWYQDPRALVDVAGGKLLATTVANKLGYDGQARDGWIEVTSLDLATGERVRFGLKHLPSYGAGDDHNAAALSLRPDGRYLAVYAGHNDASRNSYYRITARPHDNSAWQDERAFNWAEHLPGTKSNITYSNLFMLDGKLLNFGREDRRSPNIAWSDDHGETWRYGGKLTVPSKSVAYSNGYFRFTGNGTDRIDFIATEHHPRDFNNGVYHGYVQGGRSYDSSGKLMDDNILDEQAPAPEQFTPLFTPTPEDDPRIAESLHRGWTVDVGYWAPYQPHALFSCRYGTTPWPLDAKVTPQNSGAADHRMFYARWTGGRWQVTEMCKLGRPTHTPEQDYTGLGALDPSDPDRVYVCTHVDPRDGANLPRRELFRAQTADGGQTWTWTPLTWNSTAENCRPVVLTWGEQRAILWWRGRYDSQSRYDLALVGLREARSPAPKMTFTRATVANTPAATGWRVRDYTPELSVLVSNERGGGEDAPPLDTTVQLPAAGTYDVWVCFWSNPQEDWRIQAGLSPDKLLTYRRQACQQVSPEEFDPPVVTTAPTVALYRAWLGQVTVARAGDLHVYVDDTADGPADGTKRTWYGGVAVAGR